MTSLGVNRTFILTNRYLTWICGISCFLKDADWISEYYMKAILRGVNEFVSLLLTLCGFLENRRNDGRTLLVDDNEITLTHIP
jgi:hypothetical protein